MLSTKLASSSGSARLALTRFDHVLHRKDYENDLFAALRYE